MAQIEMQTPDLAGGGGMLLPGSLNVPMKSAKSTKCPRTEEELWDAIRVLIKQTEEARAHRKSR